MRPLPLTLLVWFALAVLCNGAIADAPTVLTTDNARSSGARIDHHTAESTALAQVPGGRVIGGELEREHGHLIWSFDIAVPGSRSIREIHVSARSGRVLSMTTETVADQAREAAADSTPMSKN